MSEAVWRPGRAPPSATNIRSGSCDSARPLRPASVLKHSARCGVGIAVIMMAFWTDSKSAARRTAPPAGRSLSRGFCRDLTNAISCEASNTVETG